ncbi:hypothetical protein F4820DRAFT_416463 [Hypoxylon rubiginosum]|uniref:Uncharacterized protein n=1 Tax=Hypoxylon rubiginosum TaxID=110542 RepID=A0ACB9Z5H6_9PEZI|nr:hypothetical protein F4820DRAFT_416463 [Hypoxylon rubiginosum]
MKDRSATSKSFEFLEYGPPGSVAESNADLSVKKDSFWSYCGPLLSDPEAIPSSLHDWSSAVLSSPLLPLLLPFLTFANDFLTRNGLDHYWLTIRATRATAEFNRPRWHTDDLFFSRESGSGGGSGGGQIAPQPKKKKKARGGDQTEPALDLQTDWKLCATLLGPSTLFVPAPDQAAARSTSRSVKRALATDHACTSIRCVGCAATADAVRERLCADLAPLGRVCAAPGECAFFRIGPEEGAVHSEPCMSRGDRVFVNVVPGSRDELEGLVARWGMGFPRSWWVAPGVLRGHDGS